MFVLSPDSILKRIFKRKKIIAEILRSIIFLKKMLFFLNAGNNNRLKNVLVGQDTEFSNCSYSLLLQHLLFPSCLLSGLASKYLSVRDLEILKCFGNLIN